MCIFSEILCGVSRRSYVVRGNFGHFLKPYVGVNKKWVAGAGWPEEAMGIFSVGGKKSRGLFLQICVG